jgi:hypothetical protein
MARVTACGVTSQGGPAPRLADERWRRVVLVASTCGAAACGSLALLSFFPSVLQAPTAVLIVLAIGIFPVHLRTVLVLNRRRRAQALRRAGNSAQDSSSGSSPGGLLGTEAAGRFRWLGLVVAFAAVSFFTAFVSLQGEPTIVHGSYFLNDHGSLIRVSYDAYRRAVAAQARIFTAIPCVSYSAAAAVSSRPRSMTGVARGQP